MIIRVVGQNGGGSRVYVHQLNSALSDLGKHISTFYKEFKPGDPITTTPPANCTYHYSINPIKILLLAIRYRNEIEYIHSHLRNATIICHLICRLVGLRHIVTIHGPISYGKKSLKDKLIIYLFKLSLEKAAAALFISEFTLRKTLELCKLKHQHNFRVIYNGSENPNRSHTERSSPTKFRIIMVGELTDRKRPLEAITLCKILNADKKIKGKFRIDVYGDGHLRSQFLNQINAFKLNDTISLHGNVYDIDKIYADASIHLIFAYDEGFGRVITDSMAHGIPTIAFKSGAFPEIIQHGHSGFLFSDTPDCANQLRSIILNEIQTPSADSLSRIFSENFSALAFKENTIRAINEALA